MLGVFTQGWYSEGTLIRAFTQGVGKEGLVGASQKENVFNMELITPPLSQIIEDSFYKSTG